MRRIIWLLCAVCMMMTAAFASAEVETQENPLLAATDALYSQIQERTAGKDTEDIAFHEQGDWMSVVARTNDGAYVGWQGVTYDLAAGALVSWDDLFIDGDAAAAQIEAIAEAASSGNAYSEHNDTAPVPRDNFAVVDGQLRIYYPPEQLSYFSGRAEVLSLYAYELEGLWQEGVPVTRGDTALAAQAMEEALSTGALPGGLAVWPIGTSMAAAEEALILVDTPNLTHEEAVWHFEAPEMRGVSFLSALDEDRIPAQTIDGIYAERIDFSGLCTGIATREECVAALGEPAETRAVETTDAYSRLPVGETLVWTGHGRTLSLHFVEDALHSITLAGEM